MTDLKYNPKTRELSGTAVDLNDWARKCDDFEKETGINVDNPAAATAVRSPDGIKKYKMRVRDNKK